MKIIKQIILFPFNIIKTIFKGLMYVALFQSRGFYFYLEKFFVLIKKILPFKFWDKIINHFKKRQEQPEYFLVIILLFFVIIALYNILYVGDEKLINNNEFINEEINNVAEDGENNNNQKVDLNLYRNYGEYKLDQIDINKLKETNNDTVAWLSVDYTGINYPIVQTTNNDYYLNHSFDKSYNNSGWTFMDYRNSPDMSDYNTVFYGHTMYNKTGFGSLSNVFTSNYIKKSDHSIVVITENKKYIYKVFSAYYVEPELYYLKTNFNTEDEYKQFLKTIKERNTININEDVTVNDKIITLSTCSNNKGRRVVHAKLVSVS